MILRLAEIAKTPVLGGSRSGKEVLAASIAAISKAGHVQMVLVDFTGVDVATSSFLRETVLRLRDFGLSSLPRFYVVLANMNDEVFEELSHLLRWLKDGLLYSDRVEENTPRDVRVVGNLDPTETVTYDLAVSLRTVTARSLVEFVSDADVGVTAWNNRLASLVRKGLLKETREGKIKYFSPSIEEQ